LTRLRSAAGALALGCWLVAACTLLRPLEDLETSQSSLAPKPCPEEMQQVRFEDGTTFCIDRRETTRAEYDEFLAAPVAEAARTPLDPELCPTNDSLEPGGGADCSSAYEPGIAPELPVACVDLCDAMAYCGFRGKRLCGGRGGTSVDEDAVNLPTEDEWFLACTGGTGRLYPYAATFEPRRCNIDSQALEAVQSARGCETPAHIEQQSGNVAEWTLICKSFPRRGGIRCLVRGGGYLTTDRSLAGCHQGPRNVEMAEELQGQLPTDRGPAIGIRCCRD
jgi:formylglycine-generating enzyme required for sulfatase activity